MHRFLAVLPFAVVSTSALAQAPSLPTGRVAESAAGQAGERRVRGEAIGGIEPLARVDSRVQNRIRSRLRTRIDRDYDPQAVAASPFEAADDRSRAAGRSRQR